MKQTDQPTVGLVTGLSMSYYLTVGAAFCCFKLIHRLAETHQLRIHVIVVALISGTVMFLFFLARGIFLITFSRGNKWHRYQLVWKIPIAIVFPLLGLAINNGVVAILGANGGDGGIFGDFNNYWFYVLALINGVLLCLPNRGNAIYRIFLFAGRSITMAYTFYFFLVFLPFLPLSILAVILVGVGFLMLTPLVLFVVHVSELAKDVAFLKTGYPIRTIRLIAVNGFLLIPLIITVNFLHHRTTLIRTLDYLYAPDYSKTYRIDKASLLSTVNSLQANKRASRDFFSGYRIPYLTTYFNWLVLDNLSLSDAKIAHIEKVFENREPISSSAPLMIEVDSTSVVEAVTVGSTWTSPPPPPRATPLPEQTVIDTAWFVLSADNERSSFINTEDLTTKHPGKPGVFITRIGVESTYDRQQDTWMSRLDLELTNGDSQMNWRAEEYATTFTLPTGCWISDYYLYVGDRKEAGILAEKKSAMWVYANIRDENKDPGILYYQSGNQVAFRVFPFETLEVRKTGIEFIHKGPVQLVIDGRAVRLGKPDNMDTTWNTQHASGNVLYLSAQEKSQLPEVQRTPYYHFLVDRSYGSDESNEEFLQRIDKLMAKNNISSEHAQLSWVSSFTSTVPMDNAWREKLRGQPCEGGFFLERAITKALFDSYKRKADMYPVLVVVTDQMENAIVQTNFMDLAFTFPETDRFYLLETNGKLQAHSLLHDPRQALVNETKPEFRHTVRAYPSREQPIAYLPDNREASIVLKTDLFDLEEDIREKDWQTALSLQGKWMSQLLHPETVDKEWLNLVKYSFISRIMTPVTSYLVVENEAQKAILQRKQEQVLAGNKHYDLGDETQRMSEPGLLMLVGLLGLVLAYREYRDRQKYRS